MVDSISISETNKIRIALGLQPVADPNANANSNGLAFKEAVDDSSNSDSDSEDEASTLETRQAAANENWKELEEERVAKEARSARQDAIKRARDAAKRFTKLEGKGLGDADEDLEVDARAWLKGQKKRQKKLAKKMEAELAEREREGQASYGSEDLKGVKVAHVITDFGEGEDTVLTLKDTTIEENEEEGDELENLNLVEKGRTRERIDAKKRNIVYNPNDDVEGTKGILSQYDEEIDGKKRSRFTLDGKGNTEEQKEAKREEVGEKLKRMAVSLDMLEAAPENDYLDASAIKVKKPKKSKKSTRQKAVDEDDLVQVPEVPVSGVAKKRTFDDASFVDDDDLQASLAAQRRQALKKRKKLKPEELARQLREEAEAELATPSMDIDGDEPGLVIDETSEFVSNLQKPEPQPKKVAFAVIPNIKREPLSPSLDAEGDINMSPPPGNVKTEEEEEDEEITSTGITAETTLTHGLGATLNMLTSRGLLQKPSEDVAAQSRNARLFLAAKQRRELDSESAAKSSRERDRNSGRLASMTAREKEEHARQENKTRELQETRRMAELFNNEYKPNVVLKYVDESGRRMDQKEAFKHLSHQFHGKGSGKGKTEKRIKKIAEEDKREREGLLDTSQRRAGLDSAMGAVGQREGKAGVRLQ